jgi:hypothetical protein
MPTRKCCATKSGGSPHKPDCINRNCQGTSGKWFYKVFPFLPGVVRVTKWHFKFTNTKKEQWNVFFNQKGRITIYRHKDEQNATGASPEKVLQIGGWEAQEIK